MKRELDPYTLRIVCGYMTETAKRKRYIAVQFAPNTFSRGLKLGAAETLEEEVSFWREQARKATKARRVAKLTPATTLCGPVPATPRKPATKAKRKGRKP